MLLLWEVVAGGAAMLAATLISRPVDRETLRVFYARVRPPGAWGPVREPGEAGAPVGALIARWVLTSLMIFAGMFGLGSLLIGTWAGVAGYALVLFTAGGGLWMFGLQVEDGQMDDGQVAPDGATDGQEDDRQEENRKGEDRRASGRRVEERRVDKRREKGRGASDRRVGGRREGSRREGSRREEGQKEEGREAEEDS